MQKVIWIWLIYIFPSISWGQNFETKLAIYDRDSKLPIENVHIFFNNTSFGATSDSNGKIMLSFPKGLTEDLVFSHISYETKIIENASFRSLSKKDSVFLESNGFKIDEVIVAQKRSKSWKKKLKKFKKAFLGEGKTAKKCKIRNPEVLRFQSDGAQFKATAVDMLSIQNDYLGYSIKFVLDHLSIDKNGSMKYFGHANFTDISTPKNIKKLQKNRTSTYQNSPNHFFKYLIKDELNEGKYEIRQAKYVNGEFVEINAPQVSDILYYDSTSNRYLLSFDDFLQIKHLGIKETKDMDMDRGISQGGLESTRFNVRPQGQSLKITHPHSWLYKITPLLIINPNGNIENHRAVQEYGYWANQRMAYKLPLDYGIDYSEYSEFELKNKNEDSSTASLKSDKKQNSTKEKSSLALLIDLLYGVTSEKKEAFEYLNIHWKNNFAPPLLDLLRVNQDAQIRSRIINLLKSHIDVSDYYAGLQWMWNQDSIYDSFYGNVKAEIYQHIDPKFKTYFENRQNTALIGLDEIVWGGVLQDGIPPLRKPKMIPASDANYLSESDIIFGISIDGDHRAYPKRILAWHEFFVDEIANQKIAGVYCTLCGTMIAYDMTFKGNFHNLGTSGFLYQSNKLMYDQETQSLWSTIDGTPVLGPLTGQDIKLMSYPTITTTWGDWQKIHPTTKVLSKETGYNRNYNEGEAYKAYFSTDQLMFPVPKIDNRLKNKDEVLVIRAENYTADPIAISIDFLKRKSIFQGEISNQSFVAIAENDGWTRVFKASNNKFKSYKNGKIYDENGNAWQVNESFILGPDNVQLARISSHHSFWFAWFNAHPDTRLIH